MTSEQDSTHTSQGRMVMLDYLLVGVGLIAYMEAYRLFPEEPAVMLAVFGSIPLLLGGIRLVSRHLEGHHAE